MTIRTRIQTAAIVAVAIVMLAAPASSLAAPSPLKGGSCKVHVDSVEPLGLNVLGVCI